jgi:hypothetical protein
MLKYLIIGWLMTLTVPVTGGTLLEKLPKDVSTLSDAEQANLLNQIAVFSYQILSAVPTTGLSTKRPAIEEIISIRQWLVETRRPLFQLLAIQLQSAVDVAIFNELWRENQTRVSRQVYTPFQTGSFDQALVEALLSLNAVPESPWLEYALHLPGRLTESLIQKNYPLVEYLNGVALEKMPTGLSETFIQLFPLMPWQKLSRTRPGEELLSETLRNIDEARILRMVVKTYSEHGGFPPSATGSIDLRGKAFGTLLKQELQTHPQTLTREGSEVLTIDVHGTMERYIEREPLGYLIRLTWRFYPYFRKENQTLIPKVFGEWGTRQRLQLPSVPEGQWLTFKD